MDRLIYEKRYPVTEDDLAEKLAASLEDAVSTFRLEIPVQNTDQDSDKDTVYVPIPGVKEKVEEFITKAIEISKAHKIDIQINEYFSFVTVNLYFYVAGSIGYLAPLFAYADDVFFFNSLKEYALVLSLDCYTRSVYKGDQLVKP